MSLPRHGPPDPRTTVGATRGVDAGRGRDPRLRHQTDARRRPMRRRPTTVMTAASSAIARPTPTTGTRTEPTPTGGAATVGRGACGSGLAALTPWAAAPVTNSAAHNAAAQHAGRPGASRPFRGFRITMRLHPRGPGALGTPAECGIVAEPRRAESQTPLATTMWIESPT